MLTKCNSSISSAIRLCLNRAMSGLSRGADGGDLRYFLTEVSSFDFPKEARYWMRHFQENRDPGRSFAVIQISRLIIDQQHKLAKVCDAMAFLQRNGMPVVLIHGVDDSQCAGKAVQSIRDQIRQDSIELIECLSKRKCHARPVFLMNTIQAEESDIGYTVSGVDKSVLDWCLSGSVNQCLPVVASLAETHDGQIVSLPTSLTTQEIAAVLQPMKVMFLELAGGLRTLEGKVVPQVQFFGRHCDVQSEPWFTGDVCEMVSWFSHLLEMLPPRSSAVITSPDKLLQELFTHSGSGTIFQKREPINRIRSLNDVDLGRFQSLLERSFQQKLNSQYFDRLDERLDSIYLSDGYSQAAVITKEPAANDFYYLDKFVIGQSLRGDGIATILWSQIRRDYSNLFWRSKIDNPIRNWYFQKAEGSWKDEEWIIYWYGINNRDYLNQLIHHAITMDQSFGICS
ncbi:N-acetylglutamate synthase, mitochondrial-like [Corticium candelabrum]|uniref:N-acetylglutamate synthase, mitochondrial-like n=1 Tax=Corticium candelabrum TaxID=121492 RepID=UPI002E25B41E|nr:N-acetylglutamate synthase, mitochondrial-like [Corticium candelabrum]XP_062519319.1 N-acetylglutamate synthase, mitochondrial-like [Corticium candelabrum]